MKFMLKNFLRKIKKVIISEMHEDIVKAMDNMPAKQSQLILYHMYREMALRHNRDRALPTFTEVGFRCHSQFEEDGILLYIFGLIGPTNKTCVEIGAGNGIECNTANLIRNHGWWGYLFDGDKHNVSQGIEYFHNSRDTFLYPPKFNHSWVTAENVNDLIRKAGVSGNIDLLSLDIDGMDYWIWKAIDCIQPRVVVCETHNAIGPDEPLTVPYDASFRATIPDYQGASLAAMTKLANQKGYRLVGTHRYGFNAFFIRNGLGEELLPEVTVESCLEDPCSRHCREVIWPKIREMKWVKV